MKVVDEIENLTFDKRVSLYRNILAGNITKEKMIIIKDILYINMEPFILSSLKGKIWNKDLNLKK